MLEEFLAELEPILWRVALRKFGALARRRAEIHRAILELSRIYNAERPFSSPFLSSEELLLARLVFFTPGDLVKAAHPLSELLGAGQLTQDPLRVLDLGCGCGSLSLALLGLLRGSGRASSLQVTALDREEEALEVLSLLWQELREMDAPGAPSPLTLVRHDLARPLASAPPYDCILVGNVLNEFPEVRRLPLVLELLDALSPRGHLLLLEPALRWTSRSLHALGDRLLQGDSATVFAPCTHAEPCPALVSERDWCHESRLWRPPPELRGLAATTRLRRRDLTWSYLVLNRHGARLAVDPALRVVGAPIRSKGKREIFLCGKNGRVRATLLQRDRSPGNAAFHALNRGYLTWIESATTDRGEMRLGPCSNVRLIDPAQTSCSDEMESAESDS